MTTTVTALLVLFMASESSRLEPTKDNAVSRTCATCPQVGDPAPAFQAGADTGGLWKSSETMGKKYLVLVFYPGDFKFCSIRQAQKYRDKMAALRARGAVVMGISGDSAATHGLFKKIHGLNFTLLADQDGAIARAFGVRVRDGGTTPATAADGTPLLGADGGPLQVRRGVTLPHWTFVIDVSGKIIYRNTQVSPVADAQATIEFLDSLPK